MSDGNIMRAGTAQFAAAMTGILREHQRRYPLMNEEDTVKLVFQAMLGVGHLISSREQALVYLKKEMEPLEPDLREALTEQVGPDWFRLNLRTAKAKGILVDDIVRMLCGSAEKPLAFTRRDVHCFCTKADKSKEMCAAAAKLPDENWLPSHSQQYREAYRPAYRVIHRDYLEWLKKNSYNNLDK